MTSELATGTVGGSCFCGEVAYEIDLPTLFCGHCHCSMCRRPHGPSYTTWAGVPHGRFRVTAGASKLKTYASSKLGRRQFCTKCGSQLFCWLEHEDGSAPTMIDVTVASLRGQIDRAPDTHYYYDSRADWTVVNDDLRKLGGITGTEPLHDARERAARVPRPGRTGR